jgi:EAL domain-containing protein (putative c-di-GMP-specific phosphodiesterase class I)
MAEDRLVLFSQPIVPLGRGLPREELLLRMEEGGRIVAPGCFLPAAERDGYIVVVDRWVIGRAAELAAEGRRIDVNLSAASLSRTGLLAAIEHELSAAGADPSLVTFELTETALMADIDAGERFAHGLRSIGCGLALDDFGTGFGSFTYLKRLPITQLKIDIDFVRELRGSDVNRHLVKAIVGLAADFGYTTIAEGVEDAATLRLLGELGVDYAQGYHLGRPAPLG